jgi:hypothetical protein
MPFKEIVMRSIHLHDVHAPKGPDLFAFSVDGIVCFSIALFSFLVSWAVGGDGFKANIGGNVALGVLVGGLVLSAVLAAVTKPEK